MTRRTSIKLMAGAIAAAVLPLPTVARSLKGAVIGENPYKQFWAMFLRDTSCGIDMEWIEITREEFNAEVERRASEAKRRPLGDITPVLPIPEAMPG